MNDKRNGLRLTIPTMKIVAPPHDCSEIKSRLASLLATSMNPASHKQRLARTESAIPSNASCDGMADLSREEFPPVEKSGDVIPAGYRIRRRPVVLQPDPLFLAIGVIPAFPPLHHSNPPAALYNKRHLFPRFSLTGLEVFYSLPLFTYFLCGLGISTSRAVIVVFSGGFFLSFTYL